ncbi:hypothetical protein [Kaistella palustris]|uniref:hypothetical protein n=1 Tax=Kaistella palustris TaxID=493376 RepID=UPI0003F8C6F8|nr:hypothetical protein [Kaistella palustris]
MKFPKILASAFALTLLFNVSCRKDDDPITPQQPKGAYENGILITNEGGFSTPTSSVSFLSSDLTTQEDNIFATNNSNATLGNVFQSVGFKDDLAYLVLNVPNKVEIVNRYTFAKTGTITSNLSTPRYIAFTDKNTYITNNDFFSVRKVNIYDNANTFVKSINFDRYAEKIAASGNYVYVQTDGSTYDTNYNELPTGHTITRINATTNEVDKVITLDDELIIKDMAAEGGFVYVLTSNNSSTNLYKIAASAGTAQKITLDNVAGGTKLALENNKLYLISAQNKVYSVTGTAANELFTATANNVYGFNVINGNIYIADPTFSSDSKVRIYNQSGTLLKTLTTGIGTNGFYKN